MLGITLSDLVLKLSPSKLELVGDDRLIKGVGAPSQGASDLLCFIESDKYLEEFAKSQAQSWILSAELFGRLRPEEKKDKSFLLSSHPYIDFVKALNSVPLPRKAVG